MATADPPAFESGFLRSLNAALLRRRKAILNHLKRLDLHRGWDERNNIAFERMDLEMQFLAPPGTSLRFTAWEDSMAWVSVRQLKKKVGWKFRVEFHTDLWDIAPGDIVHRIEATMALRPSCVRTAIPEDEDRLKRVWTSVAGPTRRDNRQRY
jgi:hypothetical protein